tara:strand:+ start:889 stop:1302 length:414 start_codon:yes stop_codon:yes gene_type:complete
MLFCEILSGLWISDIEMLNKDEFLKDNLITIVINCTIDHNFPNVKNKLRFPISPMFHENDLILFKNNINKILDYIHSNIDTNNILVCCYDGINISTLIIGLYIKKYCQNIPLSDIPKIISSKNTNLIIPYDLSIFKI